MSVVKKVYNHNLMTLMSLVTIITKIRADKKMDGNGIIAELKTREKE